MSSTLPKWLLRLGSNLFSSEDLVPGAGGTGAVEGIRCRGRKRGLLHQDGRVVVRHVSARVVAADFDPVAGAVQRGQSMGPQRDVEVGRRGVRLPERQADVAAHGTVDVGDVHVLLLLAGTVVVDLDLARLGGLARQQAADTVDDVAADEAVGQRLVDQTPQVEADRTRLDGVARDRLAVGPEARRGDEGEGEGAENSESSQRPPAVDDLAHGLLVPLSEVCMVRKNILKTGRTRLQWYHDNSKRQTPSWIVNSDTSKSRFGVFRPQKSALFSALVGWTGLVLTRAGFYQTSARLSIVIGFY